MFSENSAENNIDDVTDKFPSVLVELEKDKDYGYERIKFSWEDKNFLNHNKSYDRAFSMIPDDTLNNSLPALFQLTSKENKSAEGNQELWDLEMYRDEIYEVLIDNGLEILKNISKEYLTTQTPVSMFSKDVIIKNKPYVITYMSPEIYIAGVSMRDNYVKRIMSRRVEKKSS